MAGSLNINALVLSGARGALLKSNAPYSSALAEMERMHREKRRRFKVSLPWGRNSSQSWRGHSMLTVAKVVTKCSLKVAIMCSTALTQWL